MDNSKHCGVDALKHNYASPRIPVLTSNVRRSSDTWNVSLSLKNTHCLTFVSDFFIGAPEQTEFRGNSLTLSTYKRRTDLGTLVVPSMNPTNPLHVWPTLDISP